MKKFILRLFRFLSRKFNLFSERIEFRNCKADIFRYIDCFETVKVVTKYINPKIVCDIGANKGQWSYVLSQIVDLEQVVLFEPQSDLQDTLEDLDLGDAEKCIFQCALGEDQGKMKLSGGSPSASLLNASRAQHDYFPGSFNDDSEIVLINRLDEIYQQNDLSVPDLIKLDVQGYELNVLRSGTDTLGKTKYLVVELSFKEFYVGQPPLWELMNFLDEQNFVLVDYGYALRARISPNEILQIDGIFMNRKLVKQAINIMLD
jgi:FkbM family methyltransferase